MEDEKKEFKKNDLLITNSGVLNALINPCLLYTSKHEEISFNSDDSGNDRSIGRSTIDGHLQEKEEKEEQDGRCV